MQVFIKPLLRKDQLSLCTYIMQSYTPAGREFEYLCFLLFFSVVLIVKLCVIVDKR